MPNLVGTGLNQVPTNSMLGGLAYQDPEHASIKDLDLKNLSQINSEIADTATDIFVYDTRKDSDGGAWRKRTQHTSWYNETLGTVRRGTRKEFPAVAVIVAETNTLTIYDGDDPDLPMWMKWTKTTMLRGDAPRALAAKNGIIAITNASTYGGLVKIYFVSDTARSYRALPSNNNSEGYWLSDIAGRDNYSSNNYSNNNGGNTLPTLVSENTNDVAMTVLPNAPIDDATGLPIPTVAVATNGGVSVIKDDGKVVNKGTNSAVVYKVGWMTPSRLLATAPLYYGVFEDPLVPESAGYISNISNSAYYTDDGNGTSWNYPRPIASLVQSTLQRIVATDSRTIVSATNSGLNIHKLSESSLTDNNDGMVSYVTTTYNTGWMTGDVQGAFLADTNAENLTANTNLASACVQGGTSRLSSETYSNGATSWQMVDNAGTSNGYVVVAFKGLTVGQTYHISMTWDNNATLDSGYEHRVSHLNGLAGENATNFHHWNKTNGSSETLTGLFIAQSSDNDDLVMYANAITLNVTNFNIRAVDEEDRTVHNKGMAVYGNLVKSAVATGADLMGYSNFSASNHLRQPRNSSLNLGNGDGYQMIWFKTTSSSGTMMMMSYEGGAVGTSNYGTPFNIRYENGSVRGWASHDSFTTHDDVNHGVSTADGHWHHAAWVKDGRVFRLYVDGEFVGSDTGSVGSNSLGDINSELVIGGRKRGLNPGTCEEPWNGSLALARMGKTAPPPEEIKKIYEDERFLFQENAKCTLYGSSNAVTALGYDEDTELLHVGTSSGRSEFQGLRRINNTTTAVTTAISASNGLVAEQ